MVLFKRKAVIFTEPPPLPSNLSVPVWYIPQTREWFLEYDAYLSRLDYYNIRKFVCEITGNSCLTYFEAYKSEIYEIDLLKRNFPENLKEPILRRIQFSTIARIDQLVDYVYSEFKNDYYPGEIVYVRKSKDLKITGPGKLKCIIREKTRFNSVTLDDGTIKPGYANYRLVNIEDHSQTLICGDEDISRDRNQFTKTFARTFIKLCMTKSSKIGAPWIVKTKYAERYRIPTELPAQFSQFKEPENPASNDVGTTLGTASATVAIAPKWTNKLKPLTNIKPKEAGKVGKLKLASTKATKGKAVSNGTASGVVKKQSAKKKKTQSVAEVEEPATTTTTSISTPQPAPTPTVPPPPPPPPTIKDDFLYPLQTLPTKPQPTILSTLGPHTATALSIWTFLNIYRAPLMLDTFTFDDFLTALCWNTSSVRCQLLDEIFCALLSAFMEEGGDKKGVVLPEEFEASEDWGKMINEFEEAIKRGESMKKEVEFFEEGTNDEEENEDEDGKKEDEQYNYETQDKVEEYLKYRNVNWTTRLSKRQFKEGNWQIILIGLMDELRHYKPFSDSINTICSILAPLDRSVNPQNIQNQFFKELSIDLRLRCLEIITAVLVNTPLIRQFIEATMDQSAQLRRERLDLIRDYKTIYEKAQDIDRECRVLLEKLLLETSEDVVADSSTPVPGAEVTSTNSSPDHDNTKKRRRTGLKISLTDDESRLSSNNDEFKQLLDIRISHLKQAEDLRAKKKVLEKTLNEIDIQRIVCLGRDRYFNKYWWFENNGLPSVKGKKTSKRSSSANDDEDDGADGMDDDDDDDDDESDGEEVEDETYLMGRLWVQGPSVDDVVHGLGLDFDDISKYVKSERLEDVAEEESEEDEEHESMIKQYRTVSDSSPDVLANIEQLQKIKFNAENKQVLNIAKGENPETIVDTTGATNTEAIVSPFVRKLIEETSDHLLLHPNQWKHYETTEDFESLLRWLNPYGTRESALLTALNEIKDQVSQSFIARRRAMKVDALIKEETDIRTQISEIVISDTEPESDGTQFSSSSEEDESDDEMKEDQRRTRRTHAQSQLSEIKRREREERNLERALKSKASARIQRRENRKRQRLSHNNKREEKETLHAKLKGLRLDNVIGRVLGWVNSSAVEKLGHSHYEGKRGQSVSIPGRGKSGRKFGRK